jgi:beta-ribofuranosylaminobenzene 5'-phosphate synthase
VVTEHVTAIAEAYSRLADSFAIKPCRIGVETALPEHVGLGSKTATVLASLAAAARFSGVDVSVEDLQLASGRGGTSGVGIHGFFRGGFVADGGQPEHSELGPSRGSKGHPIPPLISNFPSPASWRFGLWQPPGVQYEGGSELRLFRENLPLSRKDALEMMALAYHGVAVAFRLEDLTLLKRSLYRIQRTGFKAVEVAHQPDAVRRTLARFDKLERVATGMSSVGPLVFTVHHAEDTESAKMIAMTAMECEAQSLGTWAARNNKYRYRWL